MRKATILVVGMVLGGAAMFAVSQHSWTFGVPANAANSDTYRQLNLFGDVFERVRGSYVEQPDDSKLVEGAINGMLSALDPHSAYLNERAFQDMMVQTSGEFGGLGIEVTMENGLVKVIAPIDETPAARAGIQAGDLITHLDGEPVLGLTLQEAVNRMRGEVNTPIDLRLIRGDSKTPLEIRVVRDRIQIRSVRSNAEGEDVIYLRLTTFSQRTSDDMKRNIENLVQQLGSDQVKGVILDLRNNPGGLLEQAISVSDAFLDRGEIVSTRGRDPEQIERSNATPGDVLRGKPLIVLINGGSASASEIVAGALQDHRRAAIVGTRSFGKASVQTMIPLGGSNGALKLTTARYYTPAGRSIQAQGIEPDIIIEQNIPEELRDDEPRGEAALRGHLSGEGEEQAGSSTYIPQDRAEDTALQFALALIRGEKTDPAFPPDPGQRAQN